MNPKNNSSTKKSLLPQIYFCVLFNLLFLVGYAFPGETVTIVNKENVVDHLTVEDLESLYKGKMKFWEGGEKVILVLPPAESEPMKTLANKVFKKSGPEGVFRYYLKAIFQQKFTSPPKSVKETLEAVNMVTSNPGAIAVVDSDEISDSDQVKIIRVEDF